MPLELSVACDVSSELTLAFRPPLRSVDCNFSAPVPSEYWRWWTGGGDGLDKGTTRTEGPVVTSYEYCRSASPTRDGFCRVCPIVPLRGGIVIPGLGLSV